MKNKTIRIFLFLLLLKSCCFGQNPGRNSIEFNDEKILNKQLDSLFASYNNDASPGCAVTILQNGKVIAKKGYGMASIGLMVPFTHNTVVRIPYSEAREFISIAAVLIQNDGILKLDDKVKKYFPLLPSWAEQVTLWDLLNHRSGFVDEWATLLLSQNSMSNRFESAQFLRLLYTQPEPEVEPGKGYMYSNSDFGLLRLIMEKASKKNLPDWMRVRIFEPMKMGSTQMQKNPLDIVHNKADMYSSDDNGNYSHANIQKTSPGGNYYILTSANDLEQWVKAVSDSSSETYIAASYLLHHVRTMPGKENHYITGYSFNTINHEDVVFHEGVNGYNYLSRIPSEGLSVITLGNRDGDGFAEQNKGIINYFLKVPPPVYPILKTTPISLPVAELIKYEGNYRWVDEISWEGNQTRKFSKFFVDDGKLKVRYTGSYVIELLPVGIGMFYYKEGFGVQFEFSQLSPDAPMKVVSTFDDGFKGATMERDTTDRWLPSVETLTGFTGKFYSSHLDYYWNFEMTDSGEMMLKRANLPDVLIEPDGVNQFHFLSEKYPGSAFDSWILFAKDEYAKVTGFTVWSGRVMHHRFERGDYIPTSNPSEK